MHGLVNRALQCFLRDTYGAPLWEAVVEEADVGTASFEALLSYPDDITTRIVETASRKLGKAEEDVLEDLGTYLVSHRNVEALRRLLRFGGVTFTEFLHSLDDLPDRARLAVPDLDLPRLELFEDDNGAYVLECGRSWPGFCHVMAGVLRAMADDYGALAFLDHDGSGDDVDRLRISLLDVEYSEGRSFALAREAAQ